MILYNVNFCKCFCGNEIGYSDRTDKRRRIKKNDSLHYAHGHNAVKPKKEKIVKLCLCSCGQLTNYPKRTISKKGIFKNIPNNFIVGHSRKNIIVTDEHRQKISEKAKGRKHTEEAKRKMSKIHTGLIYSENHYNYGKHRSEETKEKISKKLKGKMAGMNNPFYGKHHTDEFRKNHSIRMSRENSSSWKGGISSERSIFVETLEWKAVKRLVWKRDEGICQKCGKSVKSNNYHLFHVHHIVPFEIKELRSNINNLVLLCVNCHMFIHSKKNINKDYIKENYTCLQVL